MKVYQMAKDNAETDADSPPDQLKNSIVKS